MCHIHIKGGSSHLDVNLDPTWKVNSHRVVDLRNLEASVMCCVARGSAGPQGRSEQGSFLLSQTHAPGEGQGESPVLFQTYAICGHADPL